MLSGRLCGAYILTQPTHGHPLASVFCHEITVDFGSIPIVFFQGGWGKISAAASTQHVIDRWHPALIINLGTCGGFKGHIEKGMFIRCHRHYSVRYRGADAVIRPRRLTSIIRSLT